MHIIGLLFDLVGLGAIVAVALPQGRALLLKVLTKLATKAPQADGTPPAP